MGLFNKKQKVVVEDSVVKTVPLRKKRVVETKEVTPVNVDLFSNLNNSTGVSQSVYDVQKRKESFNSFMQNADDCEQDFTVTETDDISEVANLFESRIDVMNYEEEVFEEASEEENATEDSEAGITEDLEDSSMIEEPVVVQEQERVVGPGGILNALKDACTKYTNRRNPNKEDVKVIYTDKDLAVRVGDNGIFSFPNCRVYRNGSAIPWNSNFEVKVPKSTTVQLDLGVQFDIPDGYGIEIFGSNELLVKFGLAIPGDRIVFTNREAEHSLIVPILGCTNVAYVAKFKSILCGRLVPIA